jgi:hypothetical protein
MTGQKSARFPSQNMEKPRPCPGLLHADPNSKLIADLDAGVPSSGWCLLIDLLVALVSLVAADDASRDGAYLAVPSKVACDAADDRAFDASLRARGGGDQQRTYENYNSDKRLHNCLQM